MEKHLVIDTLDTEELVKKNNLMEVSNPIFFERPGAASTDGLLSNEIFGITKDERANIFAYIDLTTWFIDPLSYKMWSRMDKNVRECIRGNKNFIINSNGELEENEKGENGILFLKKNIDKIKIRKTDSIRRDTKIEFIKKNIKNNTLFIKKYIVIPAYYRDVNSTNRDGKVSVGEINDLYCKLLIAVRGLKEAKDYGIVLSSSTCGRVQEILLEIYNWFTKEPNIGKKMGLIKRTIMSKTADLSSRLVMSAPNLKVERMEDMVVRIDTSAVPLSSLCANLFPYIIFWIRRWFENEFASTTSIPVIDKKTKKIKYTRVKDPLINFSDDNIKKQIERFMNAYSNRFIPVEIPLENGKTGYCRFKGNKVRPEDFDKANGKEITPISNRRLTWCDLIYMAAVDVSKDKHVLITRFPLNDYFGQFPTKIAVSSTKVTEPMYVELYGNTKFYKNYPKIREEDIGSNTSNLFIDTLNIANPHLGIIDGDYDGDQVTVKAVYTKEANEEIAKYMKSKRYFIDFGGKNVIKGGKEAVQCLYNLTLILPNSNLTDPIF